MGRGKLEGPRDGDGLGSRDGAPNCVRDGTMDNTDAFEGTLDGSLDDADGEGAEFLWGEEEIIGNR